jgi:hypothetical protein
MNKPNKTDEKPNKLDKKIKKTKDVGKELLSLLQSTVQVVKYPKKR